MTFAEEFLAELERQKKEREELILSAMKEHDDYMLACGNVQGLQYAIDAYKDMVKGRFEENDAGE